MNGLDEQLRLMKFQAAHGDIMWLGQWGYAEDGSEIQAASEGYVFLEDRLPEYREQAKIMYWRLRLERGTEEFQAFKLQCQTKAGRASLTDMDLEHLKSLQDNVATARRKLDELENPSPHDPKVLRRARKVYNQLRELNDECGVRQREYEACATTGKRKRELADRWSETYEMWEATNAKWLALDKSLRRVIEGQVVEESAATERQSQELEIDEISI